MLRGDIWSLIGLPCTVAEGLCAGASCTTTGAYNHTIAWFCLLFRLQLPIYPSRLGVETAAVICCWCSLHDCVEQNIWFNASSVKWSFVEGTRPGLDLHGMYCNVHAEVSVTLAPPFTSSPDNNLQHCWQGQLQPRVPLPGSLLNTAVLMMISQKRNPKIPWALQPSSQAMLEQPPP
jgi:hypothetical protein